MKIDRMPEQGESLQLLVDPMCNLFAGLVLLSVFLALFAGRNQGEERVDSASGSRFANEELLQRRTLETQLEAEAVRKKNEAMAHRQVPNANLPPLDAVNKALAEADQMHQGPAGFSVQELREALEKELEKINAQILSLQNEAEGLKKEGARLEERWESLHSSLPAEGNPSGEVRLRLPRARPTDKIPLYLLLSGGSVYPAQLPDGAEDEAHVERQRTPTEDKILPRSNRGLSAGSETDGFLQQIDRSRCYPVLVVYADSFPLYQQLRRTLEKMEISYGWEPRENGVPLRLSARGFKPEAQ